MRQRVLAAAVAGLGLVLGVASASAQQGGSGPPAGEVVPAPPDSLFLPPSPPPGSDKPGPAFGPSPRASALVPAPGATKGPALDPGEASGVEPLAAKTMPQTLVSDVPAPSKPKHPVPAPGAQKPSLSLEKIGPAAVEAGKPVAYEIVVRNSGPAAVFNVRVQDELPAGARVLATEPKADTQGDGLAWDLATLEPGAEQHLKVEVQPAGEGDFVSTATATFSASCSLQTRVTQPRLLVTQTGPSTVALGEKASFLIQVTNVGTAPAGHVILHAHLPAGLKHEQGEDIEAELGTLGPAETKKVTLETLAVKSGRQVNEATALADKGLQAAAQSVVMVTEPALLLRVSGPQRRILERRAKFDLEVANAGSAPAANVRVTDRVPPEMEFVSASDGGTYDVSSRTVTWALPTLGPGQRRGLSVTLLAKAPGNVTTKATAVADHVSEARTEASLRLEGIPALVLEVTDQTDPIAVGGETTYEIRVTNQGSCESTGVQVVGTVPEEMVPKDASGPTGYQVKGRQVVFEPLAKLAAHSDVVYRVRVQARQPGDVRFKAQMMGEQLPLPVYEEETTHVYKD